MSWNQLAGTLCHHSLYSSFPAFKSFYFGYCALLAFSRSCLGLIVSYGLFVHIIQSCTHFRSCVHKHGEIDFDADFGNGVRAETFPI
jgi:hypothetical protein